MTTSNFTIDFNNISKIPEILKKYGVVVIENVYSKQECDDMMNDVVTSIEQLGSGIDRNDVKTWKKENLPPQTRIGMHQNFLSHLPTVHNIRSDPKYKKLWEIAYDEFKNCDELISSIDGINIKHNDMAPYDSGNDWAHLDQNDLPNDIYQCIQGQLVLCNTTAAFVCSPKSHLVFSDILKLEKTGFWKITKIEKAKKLVEDVGGQWQIPIYTKAGSVIMWLSSLVHSAKYSDGPEPKSNKDVWKGWRGVFYICYRPKNEFTKLQLKKIEKYTKEKRCMNHWSTKVFPKTERFKTNFHPKIQEMIDDHTKINF